MLAWGDHKSNGGHMSLILSVHLYSTTILCEISLIFRLFSGDGTPSAVSPPTCLRNSPISVYFLPKMVCYKLKHGTHFAIPPIFRRSCLALFSVQSPVLFDKIFVGKRKLTIFPRSRPWLQEGGPAARGPREGGRWLRHQGGPLCQGSLGHRSSRAGHMRYYYKYWAINGSEDFEHCKKASNLVPNIYNLFSETNKMLCSLSDILLIPSYKGMNDYFALNGVLYRYLSLVLPTSTESQYFPL